MPSKHIRTFLPVLYIQENVDPSGLASLFYDALAALTLIILLVEMLKFSIFVFSKMKIL
jgi:hypothetical protein